MFEVPDCHSLAPLPRESILPMSELGFRWDEVRLCEWTPRWTELFEAEAARLRAACSHAVIEHVGSTAMPDLPAKPIIDILVGVAREQPDEDVAVLDSLGYRPHSEKDRGDRIFLWLGEGDVSRYHVNVTHVGSDTWRSLLRLRELLRSDLRARARYEAEKRALATQHRNDRLAYLAAKSHVIRELLG